MSGCNGGTVVRTFDNAASRPTAFMYQVRGTSGMWMRDGDSTSRDKPVIYLDGILVSKNQEIRGQS